MECTAICGYFGVGGLKQAWQLPTSPAKQAAVRRAIGVRAVSTEASPAVGKRARREQNVAGEFFVDRTCIDCDTCRWMTPTVFNRKDGKSAVYHQPTSQKERLAALQALLACPTASIRTVSPPKDITEAHNSFPLAIDPELPGVYHCGYHSEASYAATSYLITRPEGNILVDSPRFTPQLVRRIEELGGLRYMFLTHKDDVADHKKWQSRFKCERILHEDDVVSDTRDVEVKLKGKGNWTLGSDIDLIFTPGHTKGHVALLLKDKDVLFTGDHLFGRRDGTIRIDREFNWYSVPLQIESVKALIPYDFTWILPGHGRRHKFQSLEEKNDGLNEVVAQNRV